MCSIHCKGLAQLFDYFSEELTMNSEVIFDKI